MLACAASLTLAAALLALRPLRPEPPAAGPTQDPAPPLLVTDWLVLEPVDRRGRRPFPRDAVFARHLLDPSAPPPAEGDTLVGELGEARAWTKRSAGERGSLGGVAIAWAYASVEIEEGGVWLADLGRAHTLFVNGEGFAGDLYDYGFRGVPVELRAGRNDIYFTGVRGAPRLALRKPARALLVADRDATLPDLPGAAGGNAALGLLVLNASRERRAPGAWSVALEGAAIAGETRPPFPLVPLGLAKVPLEASFEAGEEDVEFAASARSSTDTEANADAPRFRLRRFDAGELRVETFRSAIDRSVQEYALLPATAEKADGLVLSLHGAGVGCRGQAASYAAAPDLWIVAPTNRRPFGFDWQDWGRLDAYEVLERAAAICGASPERVYLTGHSMGGHGTWHLASNDPDRFAAIAPSAGWESFDSYGGRPADLCADLWQDADAPSRTLARVENLVALPTFVLHGEADDNVPPSEARALLAALEAAGGAPQSHFQPEAGHWWNGEAAPGVDCLTWPAIFELFAASRRPVDPTQVRFTSADPAVDARHHWLRVEQPLAYGEPVELEGELDEARGEIRVRTRNAARIALEPPAAWKLERYVVDGFRFDAPEPAAPAIELVRIDGFWQLAPPLDASEKSPRRSGPFKRAFENGFLLVYGSHGSPRETAELLARARFDAQTWWYRGNGSAWVVADVELAALEAAGELAERNLVLYGNADTNAAWSTQLPADCPVRARRGAITVGERTWQGDGLACVFVQPRRGSRSALVGAFADSGPRGSRLGYAFQTFVSGAGFPDLALVDERFLLEGDAAVLCAGWFDARWRWRRGRVERGGELAPEAR